MRRFVRLRRGHLAALALTVPLGAAGAVAVNAQPAAAASTASVSVNTGQALATIPPTGVGMNVAVYDGNMNSAVTPGLLSAAGFGMVRYPGGSYSDNYHWQTNTVTSGYVAPNTDR